jgi:lysyl-tRNA synthetase class 1
MGIPPHKSVPRHFGITDVKNMNDALGDPRVQAVLTENLWRYLTVLYIDRRGMNLRNDLAHGLVSVEAFNQSTADIVFQSLLALSLMQKEMAASQE